MLIAIYKHDFLVNWSNMNALQQQKAIFRNVLVGVKNERDKRTDESWSDRYRGGPAASAFTVPAARHWWNPTRPRLLLLASAVPTQPHQKTDQKQEDQCSKQVPYESGS